MLGLGSQDKLTKAVDRFSESWGLGNGSLKGIKAADLGLKSGAMASF